MNDNEPSKLDTPKTIQEMAIELENYAFYEHAKALRDLLDAVSRTTEEIFRLNTVIEEQSRILSVPIFQQYSPSIEVEVDYRNVPPHFHVRLLPLVGDIIVPFDIGRWSQDHRIQFRTQLAKDLGNKFAEAISDFLWKPRLVVDNDATPPPVQV